MTSNIRELTNEDIIRFHGRLPEHKVVGLAFEWNGNLCWIAGVVMGEQNEVFSTFDPSQKVPARTVIEHGRYLVDYVKSLDIPVLIAEPDENINKSAKFLKAIGFEKKSDKEFTLHNLRPAPVTDGLAVSVPQL